LLRLNYKGASAPFFCVHVFEASYEWLRVSCELAWRVRRWAGNYTYIIGFDNLYSSVADQRRYIV